MTSPDPALTALAGYRAARADMDATYALTRGLPQREADEAEEEPFRALLAAERSALEARPTTTAGAIRLLEYLAERLASDALGDDQLELAPSAIRAAIVVLEREAG